MIEERLNQDSRLTQNIFQNSNLKIDRNLINEYLKR